MLKPCEHCQKEYMADKRHSGQYFRYCPACRKEIQKQRRYSRGSRQQGPTANSGELEYLIHWACDGVPVTNWRPLAATGECAWLMA